MGIRTVFVAESSKVGTGKTYYSPDILSLGLRPRNKGILKNVCFDKREDSWILNILKLWRPDGLVNFLSRILH